MLLVTTTEHNGGITLWGDYWDLTSLYGTVHDLVENSNHNEETAEGLLALAYDIRKSYERRREERAFGEDEYDSVLYKGERHFWPIILFQLRVLRGMASYQPTTKEQQANLYRLESCLEKALVEVDPAIGRECIDWLNMPLQLPVGYHTLYLTEVIRKYVSITDPASRFASLPMSLRSMDPLSSEYRVFSSAIEQQAKDLGGKVRDLVDNTDLPDFEW